MESNDAQIPLIQGRPLGSFVQKLRDRIRNRRNRVTTSSSFVPISGQFLQNPYSFEPQPPFSLATLATTQAEFSVEIPAASYRPIVVQEPFTPNNVVLTQITNQQPNNQNFVKKPFIPSFEGTFDNLGNLQQFPGLSASSSFSEVESDVDPSATIHVEGETTTTSSEETTTDIIETTTEPIEETTTGCTCETPSTSSSFTSDAVIKEIRRNRKKIVKLEIKIDELIKEAKSNKEYANETNEKMSQVNDQLSNIFGLINFILENKTLDMRRKFNVTAITEPSSNII